MTLSELVTRVANRTNKNPSDTATKTRLIAHVNNVCRSVWNGFEWSFRFTEYPIALTADVTSGTMTATNASKTVTASGTPFDTTLHKGAFIRFTGDSPTAFYRVQNVVSTSVVTIEPAYQGATGSGKAYELKKVDYILPPECLDYQSFYTSGMNRPRQFTSGLGDIDMGVGTPQRGYLSKPDFKGSTYSATLSASSGSRTITGAASSFLTNVMPGDTLTDGTYTYTVYSIETDTSLTLYNYTKQAIASGSYTFTRQFSRAARFLPSANNSYVFYVTGLRQYAPLVHDNDVNELTQFYPEAIEESAVRLEMGSSPDSREGQQLAIQDAWWADAKARDRKLTPRSTEVPILSLRNALGQRRFE